MADEAVPRDRQIRTEALHAATRLVAGAVANPDFVGEMDLGEITHTYAHYIHSGVWLVRDDDGVTRCPFGDACRFDRKAEW